MSNKLDNTLIPHPLTGAYKEQLMQLGKEAHRLFKVCEYKRPASPADIEAHEEAFALLEMYEKSLRRQFGVPS